MAAISDILPQVAPFVVDCPEGVQSWAAREALCRFLIDSHIWRERLEATADGTDSLSLTAALAALNPAASLLSLIAVQSAGRMLALADCELIDADVIFFGSACATPAAGETVEVDAVIGVWGHAVTDFPDRIFNLYGSAIADFALFRIMSAKNRPYSDPGGAAEALARYQAGLHVAHVQRVTGGRQGQATFTNPLPEYF